MIRGTRDVAQRSVNARLRLEDWIMETASMSRGEAIKVANVYLKAKLAKLDRIGGAFNLTHGGACDVEVMRRALEEGNRWV